MKEPRIPNRPILKQQNKQDHNPNKISMSENHFEKRTRPWKDREQWFKDRIGKRVFRTKTTCPCEVCENVYQNGLLIHDEMHADYICMYDLEGICTYFDTKEEVTQAEQSQPIQQ